MMSQEHQTLVIVAALVALITFVAWLWGALPAWSHDWYSGTQNELGWGCCGGDDCRQLIDGDAAAVPGGYYVKSLDVFVPNSRSQPGPDSHYHVCQMTQDKKDHTARCFFFPGPGV